MNLSIDIAILFCLALIMQLLAFSKGNLEFNSTILVIHLNWNKSKTRNLSFADQLIDFASTQKKLSGASRINIGECSILSDWSNIATNQKYFILNDANICFIQRNFAGENSFYFPTLKHKTAFEKMLEEI